MSRCNRSFSARSLIKWIGCESIGYIGSESLLSEEKDALERAGGFLRGFEVLE